MSKYKSGTKERALEDIANMLGRYASTKKERLLSYWLSEYSRFIKQEETFDPKYLKRYKRGEIIKVNLGYRLGKEEGGPHYAVVLDNQNDFSSHVITILPLSSKKETTRINKHTLDLGNEIYELLKAKAEDALSKAVEENGSVISTSCNIKASASVSVDFSETKKVLAEIASMKEGSIALISQITTISKMRIIKPLRTTEALSGIRLSDESLNKIDKRIIELYIGKINCFEE